MPLTPKNRKEQWLQGLVDHETTLTPKNRKETWMKEIIDSSGGGGGGGGGLLIVTATTTETSMTLNKTWKEIHDSALAVYVDEFEEGGITSKYAEPIFIVDDEDGYNAWVCVPYIDDTAYGFNAIKLSTDTENGYPTLLFG